MIKYTFVFLLGIIFQLFAQTDSLNIIWNKNSEADMYRYLLQRSVNSTSNFQNYSYLVHPDTHAVDNNVQPGDLFAYRVAAMDSAGNLSAFTNFKSVGIPGIQWSSNLFNTGKDTFLTKTSFLSDPDNQVNELQLSALQENHVVVSIQSNGIQISPSPINYIGQASFVLRVEDPDGYFDRKLIQISFYDPGQIFEFNIPDIVFDEDSQFEILLDTTISSNPFTFDDIVWEFIPGQNLDYDYENSTHIITIQSSQPNWFGEDEINIIAHLPNQTTKSDMATIVIDPVNDPPINTLQSLYVSPFSNNRFDLKLYASDVDNSLDELDWEFTGYSDFSIQWYDEANKIIEIEILDTTINSETGTFTVTDLENASDSKSVSIYYSSQNTPPHLVDLPDTFQVAEDSLISFNLVNFFIDSTHNINEVEWEFQAGQNISYSFNPSNFKLTIIPNHNWFGTSSILIKVTDPFGLSDQRIISIKVDARNDFELQIRQISLDAVRFNITAEIPSKVHLSYWYDISKIKSVDEEDFQIFHSIIIENLVSDTSYYFNLQITDTSGRQITIFDSSFYVGLSFSSSNNVVVYPNPVVFQKGESRVFFENLPGAPKKIKIFNILGQKVFEEKIQSTLESSYSLNAFNGQPLNLASGVYIYLIEAANAVNNKTGKFFVIK